MSNGVSALAGAKAGGIADVAEAGLRGMVTFRGDLSAKKVKDAIKAVLGVSVPAQRRVEMSGDKGAAWMSPDELLLIVPHGDADTIVAELSDKLKGVHFMAENVSDARAVFTVSGKGAREVLGKLAPVDMGAFAEGEIRRTRMAQVAAAFWMHGDEVFTIVCFRSMAQYMFDILRVSAEAGEVGVY